MVGVGSAVGDASVGSDSVGPGSGGALVVPMVAWVGLGGIVGFKAVVAVSAGAFVLCLGAQPARAAPAATVAVSLRKFRREMGGRGFTNSLQFRYLIKV